MQDATDAGGTPSSEAGATAFATKTVGGVTVVEIHGDLDVVSAPKLREILAGLRADEAQGGIVVDLRDCPFIDSNGLAALLHASAGLRRPPEMAVVCAGGTVARLLELTAIDQTLRVFEDVEAATSALA
jgi:anti-sigma B factor antagonist